MTDKLPEASAVGFTNVKTPNGYEWSFTMRDDTVKSLVEKIEVIEEMFKKKNWEAMPLRANYKKSTRQLEYVEGKKCPECGGRLIKKVKKDGKPYHKCENGKWNPVTGPSGCKFVDWLEPKQEVPTRDVNEVSPEELAELDKEIDSWQK